MKVSDMVIEKIANLGAIDRFCVDVIRGLEDGLADVTPSLLVTIILNKDEVVKRLRDQGGSKWTELAAWIEQFPLDYYQKLIAGVHCALLQLSPVQTKEPLPNI